MRFRFVNLIYLVVISSCATQSENAMLKRNDQRDANHASIMIYKDSVLLPQDGSANIEEFQPIPPEDISKALDERLHPYIKPPGYWGEKGF